MSFSKQQIILGGVAVAVVVAAVAAVVLTQPSQTSEPDASIRAPSSDDGAVSSAPSDGSSDGSDGSTGTSGSTGTMATKKLSYGDALERYTYKFFFSAGCTATAGLPTVGSLNIKQRTPIMLSNSDSQSHRITLGDQAVTVAAGDYAVLTTPTVDTTTGLYMTCDGKGTGRIYVAP